MTRLCLVVLLAAMCGCSSVSQNGPIIPPLPDESRLQATGRSNWFVLEPGHQLSLATENGERVRTITVLDQTRRVAGVMTRVVEERDLSDGELRSVRRSFLAIDVQTGDIWRFGVDAVQYHDGRVIGRRGSWVAEEGGASAGILVPGSPALGLQLYQGYAPDVAMQWFAVVDLNARLVTPMGRFTDCLQLEVTDPTVEMWFKTSALPDVWREFQFYAAGVGLIAEGPLRLRHVAKAPG